MAERTISLYLCFKNDGKSKNSLVQLLCYTKTRNISVVKGLHINENEKFFFLLSGCILITKLVGYLFLKVYFRFTQLNC